MISKEIVCYQCIVRSMCQDYCEVLTDQVREILPGVYEFGYIEVIAHWLVFSMNTKYIYQVRVYTSETKLPEDQYIHVRIESGYIIEVGNGRPTVALLKKGMERWSYCGGGIKTVVDFDRKLAGVVAIRCLP